MDINLSYALHRTDYRWTMEEMECNPETVTREVWLSHPPYDAMYSYESITPWASPVHCKTLARPTIVMDYATICEAF